MPSHVLYQIPYAAGPVRLLIGVVCLIFVLAIYGSWLPRATRMLRNQQGMKPGQKMIMVAVAVIPVAIGAGPLLILAALMRNPFAYVTDTGVTQERVFQRTPISLAWAEVAHVYCQFGRGGGIRAITLVSTDGRKIGFGNTGGVDFDSIHELFVNQLGPKIVGRCSTSLRG